MDGMLVVQASKRISCENIWKRLDEMYGKCVSDEDYATSGNPWHIEEDSVSRLE
jgi:hypothetical protein